MNGRDNGAAAVLWILAAGTFFWLMVLAIGVWWFGFNGQG